MLVMDRDAAISIVREKAGAGYHPSHPDSTRFAVPWTIEDRSFEAFSALVTGRTIVQVSRDPSTDESFPTGANSVRITLDDGSAIQFDAWGYDAWGLDTSYEPAGSRGSTSDGPEARNGIKP